MVTRGQLCGKQPYRALDVLHAVLLRSVRERGRTLVYYTRSEHVLHFKTLALMVGLSGTRVKLRPPQRRDVLGKSNLFLRGCASQARI